MEEAEKTVVRKCLKAPFLCLSAKKKGVEQLCVLFYWKEQRLCLCIWFSLLVEILFFSPVNGFLPCLPLCVFIKNSH